MAPVQTDADALIGLVMFAGGFVGQAAAVIIVWVGAR